MEDITGTGSSGWFTMRLAKRFADGKIILSTDSTLKMIRIGLYSFITRGQRRPTSIISRFEAIPWSDGAIPVFVATFRSQEGSELE